MLVDSHCHLDFLQRKGVDLTGVIARAQRAGVEHMLTIGTKLHEAQDVIAIAERFDRVTASVGVHPHEAEYEPDVSVEQLITLAQHPKVVGIGETGLDYFYEHSPRAAQQRSFRIHIEAARRCDLPLIVHTRDAEADTIAILQEEYAKQPFKGLIHCFSSSGELAEKAIEIGLYISISGIVTFKKAKELQAVVKTLPPERVLVETDAPYLTPVPHRGKQNEPAYTVHTAACVADLLGMKAATLAQQTTDNYFRLFTKAQP